MSKWIFQETVMVNLNNVNGIYYDRDAAGYNLWLDYNDELKLLCSGKEKKIKRKFKAIKNFLISDDEYIEFKE